MLGYVSSWLRWGPNIGYTLNRCHYTSYSPTKTRLETADGQTGTVIVLFIPLMARVSGTMNGRCSAMAHVTGRNRWQSLVKSTWTPRYLALFSVYPRRRCNCEGNRIERDRKQNLRNRHSQCDSHLFETIQAYNLGRGRLPAVAAGQGTVGVIKSNTCNTIRLQSKWLFSHYPKIWVWKVGAYILILWTAVGCLSPNIEPRISTFVTIPIFLRLLGFATISTQVYYALGAS